MKGLSGKRGPLKPDTGFRSMIAVWFWIVIPVGAAVASAISVWFGESSFDDAFLIYWMAYTSLMWGCCFGDPMGRRLAAAVGYHWSAMAARLLELAVILAAFALCSIACGTLFPPKGAFVPAFGAAIFLATGIVGFVRRVISG